MSFFAYLFQVSLYGALMWGIYWIIWRGKPAHRGSRAYLLLAALLPVLLPFIRLRIAAPGDGWIYRYQLPDVTVSGQHGPALPGHATISWLYGAYVLIAFAHIAVYAAQYFRLLRRITVCGQAETGGSSVYIDTGIGPGTLGKRIFFPGSVTDTTILQHEQAHIRSGHRYDLLLMQLLSAMLWLNPVIRLLYRELKMVHEFEADALASKEEHNDHYAQLLLSQVFSVPGSSIAHSFFHHPLKRRIMMLKNNQRNMRMHRLLAGTVLLTAALCTSILLVQCKPDKTVVPVSSTESTDTAVYKFVDHMPAFEGDLPGYLSQHLHYPEGARAANQQGRTVVQFIIDNDGSVQSARSVRSSGTAALDEEALRVVSAMPRWTPGKQNGRAVKVYFTLPITFKLGD